MIGIRKIGIMILYEDSKAVVRCAVAVTNGFKLGVGLHQVT